MRIVFAGGFALALFAAASLSAQSTATTTQEADPLAPVQAAPKPKESPLVKAAQQSGTAPKMPKKVITNKDVKKSKGKIATTSPKPLPAATEPTAPDQRTMTEVATAHNKSVREADDRVAAAKVKFDALEKDLSAIEQSYYQEKDLNVRDTVIQQRFAQAKRQLDAARKELADARDAREALTKR